MTDPTVARAVVQLLALLLFIVATTVTIYWAVHRAFGIRTPWLDRVVAWMGRNIRRTMTALVAMVILGAVKIGDWILPRR